MLMMAVTGESETLCRTMSNCFAIDYALCKKNIVQLGVTVIAEYLVCLTFFADMIVSQ